MQTLSVKRTNILYGNHFKFSNKLRVGRIKILKQEAIAPKQGHEQER